MKTLKFLLGISIVAANITAIAYFFLMLLSLLIVYGLEEKGLIIGYSFSLLLSFLLIYSLYKRTDKFERLISK